MFNLICDGKLIGSANTFIEAVELCKKESTTGRGVTREIRGEKVSGRIVSIWSGEYKGTYPYGTAKHVVYACGHKM